MFSCIVASSLRVVSLCAVAVEAAVMSFSRKRKVRTGVPVPQARDSKDTGLAGFAIDASYGGTTLTTLRRGNLRARWELQPRSQTPAVEVGEIPRITRMTYRGANPSGFGRLVLDNGCRPQPFRGKRPRTAHTIRRPRNNQPQNTQQTSPHSPIQRTRTHRIHQRHNTQQENHTSSSNIPIMTNPTTRTNPLTTTQRELLIKNMPAIRTNASGARPLRHYESRRLLQQPRHYPSHDRMMNHVTITPVRMPTSQLLPLHHHKRTPQQVNELVDCILLAPAHLLVFAIDHPQLRIRRASPPELPLMP